MLLQRLQRLWLLLLQVLRPLDPLPSRNVIDTKKQRNTSPRHEEAILLFMNL